MEVIIHVATLDSDGNPLPDMADFCEASLDVQDNEAIDLCNGPVMRVDIQGRIYTQADAELYEAEVELISQEVLMKMTDENGEYGFMDMPEGGSYTLAPHKDDDILNGVSTLDLVMIQRHILGLQEFEDPYKKIAADINNDDRLTSADLLALRKVILGVSTAFTNNTSWRFIDEAYEFVDQDNPLDESFPESYDIINLSEDMRIDFIGMKIGDVNSSVDANLQAGVMTETRSSHSLVMNIPNTEVEVDKVYEIEVQAGVSVNLKGLQMALSFQDLELIEVLAGNMNIKSNDMVIEEGSMKLSYANAIGDYVQADAKLFTLVVKAKSNGQLSEMIEINEKSLDAESYLGAELKIGNVEIEWREDENVAPVELFVAGSASPNPWRSQTNINFEIPSTGIVSLTVRDLGGKVLYTKQDEFNVGKQSFIITHDDVNVTGLLLYELQYGDQIVQKKMIRIE